MAHAQLSFSGLADEAVSVTPESSTGLNAIYVIPDATNVLIIYRATNPDNFSWQRFSTLGGGYAEPVTDMTRNYNEYSLKAETGDIGYIIDDGSKRLCYWIVNYANHALRLNSLEVDPDQSDCDRVAMKLDASGGPMNYYTVNGRSVVLDRQMTLSYRTLDYDGDSETWNEKDAVDNIASLSSTLSVEAPLCDTEFTLRGDRFLRAWHREQSVSTSPFTTSSVSATTSAVQTERDVTNESGTVTDGLGGSAPCEITFTARPTDAAVYREWQFSDYADFDVVKLDFQQDEITYTFTEQGTTYVRYLCGDASGRCIFQSDVYVVNIGESKLLCPNAFSPGNQDGVNDEWKVSYSSLISFECHIFNRWGTKLFEFTDPSLGWDGKYKGKLVPSGVYFYVIKAVGADGVHYKLSGDINIINSRRSGSASSGGETPPTE